jgi:hypothetical protein
LQHFLKSAAKLLEFKREKKGKVKDLALSESSLTASAVASAAASRVTTAKAQLYSVI